VSLSNGGKASQSSWYELLPENDGFRDNLGLLGVEAVRTGVLTPSGGDDPVEVLRGGVDRDTSGDKLFRSAASSDFAPGMGMGSDISKIVRLWAVEEETPKDTLRNMLPPLRTRPSAMIKLVNILTHMRVATETQGRYEK
jgi:hypothetical protein